MRRRELECECRNGNERCQPRGRRGWIRSMGRRNRMLDVSGEEIIAWRRMPENVGGKGQSGKGYKGRVRTEGAEGGDRMHVSAPRAGLILQNGEWTLIWPSKRPRLQAGHDPALPASCIPLLCWRFCSFLVGGPLSCPYYFLLWSVAARLAFCLTAYFLGWITTQIFSNRRVLCFLCILICDVSFHFHYYKLSLYQIKRRLRVIAFVRRRHGTKSRH